MFVMYIVYRRLGQRAQVAYNNNNICRELLWVKLIFDDDDDVDNDDDDNKDIYIICYHRREYN